MENNVNNPKDLDFTVDGKCSRCARCCQAILVMSEQEIHKIKSYIGKTKIQPINHHTVLDTEFVDVCPFLDNGHNCMIYPVRPSVCKRFLCSQYMSSEAPYFDHSDKHIYNMYDLFLPEVNYPMPKVNVLEENFKYEQKKKELASKQYKKW